MAGYFDELTKVRKTLDSRYDDIEGGKVKLIPGDVAHARLKEGIEDLRRNSSRQRSQKCSRGSSPLPDAAYRPRSLPLGSPT
jgi:hypothetical protein